MIFFLVYWIFNLCLNKPESVVMCETIRKMNISRFGETESLSEDLSCRENFLRHMRARHSRSTPDNREHTIAHI